MKKTILLSMLAVSVSLVCARAQEVKDVELKRQGEWMSVKMKIDTEAARPGRNQTVVLTPELRHGQNVQALQPVGVYSRNQWYYYTRKGEKAGAENELSFRKGELPATLNYETMLPYRTWMDGAKLYLLRESKGCCGDSKGETAEQYLASFQDTPADVQVIHRIDTVYIERIIEKESRTRSINGRAFVDFPVNDTKIYPKYHSNAKELGYLHASIDSALTSGAGKVRKIWLKGYASPEGPWETNARLAEGRTKAIKDYIVSQFKVSESLLEVEFEPENWEGFRSFVEASSLPHKAEILEIMAGDRLPDDKEWMIKSRYPEDWKTLLEQCLPYLRRTDYRIDYEIQDNN